MLKAWVYGLEYQTSSQKEPLHQVTISRKSDAKSTILALGSRSACKQHVWRLGFTASMQRTLHYMYSEDGDCTARDAEPWAHSPAAGRASGIVILAVLLLSCEPWDGSSLGLCYTHSSSPFDGASRAFD